MALESFFLPRRVRQLAQTVALACGLACALPAAADADHPTEKYRTSIAPSAELRYAIRAKQGAFTLDGEAQVRWQAGDGKYLVESETRASLFGKILESRSEGLLDDWGLAPITFTEKRRRKDAVTTTFARAEKQIRFSASTASYPLQGGEQDRTSIVWQLVAVARANAARFKPGSEWHFFVAGQRDADAWTFRAMAREKVNTVLGEFDCVRVQKAPPPGHQDQQVELWLAPELDWMPVRLRSTEADGDTIEQTLVTLAKR